MRASRPSKNAWLPAFAGMTGGMAFVHDEHDWFRHRVNPDSVVWQRIETGYWEDVVKVLVQQHVKRTHSRFALGLLNDWELEVGKFWQVVPKEMLGKLEHPTTVAEARALKSAGE